MVKTLHDICLDCLYRNFDRFANTRLDLPSSVGDLLFRRLVNHDRLTVEYLPSITYNLISPRLTTLDFYGSKQLTDNFLTHVGMACQNLRFVRLVRCLNVTDNGIAELLMNQNHVEHLELRWLLIEGRCFDRIGSLGELKTLILKGCSYVDADSLAIFIGRNRRVETLNVRGLRKINDKSMMEIVQALNTNLQRINVSECINITDKTLTCIAANCSNLRRFSLMECMNVTESGLAHMLSSCPQLEHLDLSFCSRWENAMNVNVVQLLPVGLTSLSLTGIQVECSVDHFATILDSLPHLTALFLNGFGLLSDEFLRNVLGKIGSRLQVLDLSGSFGKFTDNGLESVARYCTHLKSFGMALLNNFTAVQLRPMFADPRRAQLFRTLIFTICPTIHYEILQLIADNCHNLEKLDISGVPRVDDAILHSIANNCSKLSVLFAKAPIGITDDSICQLAAKCIELKCLSLSGNRAISDRSILTLANHCHYLQELYLSGCMMVSEMAIRYLQDQAIGRVSVYHIVPSASLTATVIAKNLDTGQYVRL